MIYITLDTCVWLGLLEVDFNNEENCFEEICFWIENISISHIAPTNIIDEWNRNKIKGKENAFRHLREKEEELLNRFKNDTTFSKIYNPDNISEIIQKRIERIDSILNTSEKANIDDAILIEAGKINLLKQPPNHIKEGYKDTVNILTLINHLKSNKYPKCFFSTIDGDFAVAVNQKHDLHNFLVDRFKDVNLEYIYFGNKKNVSDIKNCFGSRFIGELRKEEYNLPNFQDYLREKTRKEVAKVLADKKDMTITTITNPDIDYLENVKYLDLIISKKKPTSWEEDMVKSLISRHESYKQYFFNNIGNNGWFNFLKSEGYFDPSKNLESIQLTEGFQIPYWEALGYLEKLSIQISQGKETELIDELLTIIKNVSEQPKDNYRTWYLFIKILSNIPNENIPKEIIHYIPVWLSGKFDTMLQTSELCDKLLPKFLNDDPTKADIDKVEIILHYLFQVEKTNVQGNIWEDGEGNSYHSRLDLHILADKFEKTNIIPKVIKYCTSDFILSLGRTIKFLLLDYPKGVNTFLKDGDKEYEIKIHIEREDLLVSSKLKANIVTNTTSTISNWEVKSEIKLKQELVSILKEQNINYRPTDETEDTFLQLNFALNTDLTSTFRFNNIRKLDDRYATDEKVLSVFSLIFRDLINEQVKQNPVEGIKNLQTICYDIKYLIPFYRRISLYIICENWETAKALFFELIKDNDALHLFSNDKYQKELYDLLKRNQNELNINEIEIIENIIEKGKKDKSEDQTEKNDEYWKLGWYSALKDIPPFKDKYLSLSKELNIQSEHYENFGEIRVTSGSISPISKDDLIRKSNSQIVEQIKTFNPKRSFDEASIDGLSDTFGSAVETVPEKFATEIELYQDIPHIYSYRMLRAFGRAWKEQKIFDWEKVLNYCLTTLKSSNFYSNALNVENDGWRAKPDWVIGSIANLLSDGLQNDTNAFDIKLLPLAKEIIQIIIINLKRVEDLREPNMDYPTYSLNSVAGKSLKALLDYSLRRARNLFKQEGEEKWEADIKLLLEESLEKGIIDGFVLEGMYFEQFCFLDNDWMIEQVKKHYTTEDREWVAFMGGCAFGKPPYNKELYTIFYPHYERAIDENIQLKSFNNNGLIGHLTAFYFWKYETISSKKLLFKFLNIASPNEVGELIHFIWQQETYSRNLSELEQQEFQQIIIDLWKYLAGKYENSKIEEEQKNLATLSNWIVFAPELNDLYTNLILKSCKHTDKIRSIRNLLEFLVTLKTKGNPNKTANAIGKIISSLTFKDYMIAIDKDYITDLVSFLFAHEQKQTATEFCNKMASVHQQFFLREVYEANTK
ncbi:hypothetical protein [Flavobacterium sp. Arc2]|uniref:hypothetical protein n=1 Tax=Flavobacterium sp. Arc2 TaxID=3046685 RepID=UPI00352F369E